MPEQKLSVIIPCYNCAETLTEAVASVYEQNLKIPFEIVLVDDASTDDTRQVMDVLATGHTEIRCFLHSKNQGGGATRNTAVEHSTGNLIFCLDSDDILAPGTLGRMVVYWQEKNCDGVGVSTSIKFKGQDKNDIAFINQFGYVGRLIPFESLFQKPGGPMCPLYSTFMITRRAFDLIGGYPTAHGFDTQGMAFRFLANGLTAYTCPDTTYLHRVDFHKSYYLREYEAGKTNHNWFAVYEEFLYLFAPDIREMILSYDLNGAEKPLVNALTEKENILQLNYSELIEMNGQNSYQKQIEVGSANHWTDFYWLGTKLLTEGRTDTALAFFAQAYQSAPSNIHLLEKMLVAKYPFSADERLLAEQAEHTLHSYQKRGGGLSLLLRIWRKIKKINAANADIWQKYWNIFKMRRQDSPNFVYFAAWLFLRLKKALFIGFNQTGTKSDARPIDVIIPTISKDHQLLSTVLTSLEFICQPINKIFIVSRKGEFIEEFCRQKDLIFIDERSVLGYGKETIDYLADGLDRSGWLFQQLLKLSGDKIAEKDDYFVLDSDTVIVGPLELKEKDKYILYENDEWHRPYFQAFEQLFGYPVKNRLSFTSHMMIFNRQYLGQMKTAIEKRSGKTWDAAYLAAANRSEQSGISDYDTYAGWLFANHRAKTTTRPLYNRSLPRNKLAGLDELVKTYSAKYKTVSFHSYYGKDRAEIIQETNDKNK